MENSHILPHECMQFRKDMITGQWASLNNKAHSESKARFCACSSLCSHCLITVHSALPYKAIGRFTDRTYTKLFINSTMQSTYGKVTVVLKDWMISCISIILYKCI